MSFYADGQFQARPLVPAVTAGTTLLTNAGATNVGVAYPPAVTVGQVAFPTFIRRTAVTNLQVQCVVAPSAGYTGGVISFLNGTNTFATAAFGTANATIGQLATITLTTANNTFAAGAVATGTLIGTLTGTGSNSGAFNTWFEQTELYA